MSNKSYDDELDTAMEDSGLYEEFLRLIGDDKCNCAKNAQGIEDLCETCLKELEKSFDEIDHKFHQEELEAAFDKKDEEEVA